MMPKPLVIAGYIAATALVLFGTVLLIAYGNGYSYDFKTGRLIHRGLVLLSSEPNGAKITLGSKHLKKSTPYRNSFEAGSYEFKLEKEGYRSWQKSLNVIPSRVTLAQYVIMVPNNLTSETVGSYPSVSQVVTSRDHHRSALVVPDGAGAGVWSLNNENGQQTRLYSSAAATADQPAETVQVISWADDNSHLLLKSQIGATIAYKLISDNPSDAATNLTTTFNVDLSSIFFDTSDWHKIYWRSPEGLRLLNVSDRTISAVLATNVAGVTDAGDRLLYVDNSGQQASLWSLTSNGKKQKLISNLPQSASYELDFASYIGTPQVAVVAQDSRATTLYTDIYDKPQTKGLPLVGTHVTFNNDGRFLVISDEHHISSYDLELGTTYAAVDTTSTLSDLSWFDNYHLLFNRDGKTILSEFDGNYAQEVLTTTLAGIASPDTKSVFGVTSKKDGSVAISQVKIRN